MSANKKSKTESLSKIVRFIALAVIAVPALSHGEQLTQDPATYPGYQPPGTDKTVYLTPLWMNCGDWGQPDNGDHANSIAVTSEAIYITDSSDSENPKLWRFDPATGRRLSDLPITYGGGVTPPPGLINHVGADTDGCLYVSAEVRDSAEPTVNIDIIDLGDGTVTRRLSHNLKELSPERYIQIDSRYIGHPEVTGSLASGDYEVAVTETFDFHGASDPDGTGIRLWRIRYEGGVSDGDPRASKLYLPYDETDGRLEPYIKVDENARVTVIDESRSIVDDGVNPPMYFRVRNLGVNVNSWLEPSGGSVDPKAIGVALFEWDGQRYMAYGSGLDGGVRFSISHWVDTGSGLDGGNIMNVWTVPSTPQGMGAQAATLPLTLARAVDDASRNWVNVYLYSPGNGLAAYSISDRRQSGTTDIADMVMPPQWELSGRRLNLSSPRPLRALRPDGTTAGIYPPSTSHDLSGLRQGVYILISEPLVIKYTDK